MKSPRRAARIRKSKRVYQWIDDRTLTGPSRPIRCRRIKTHLEASMAGYVKTIARGRRIR